MLSVIRNSFVFLLMLNYRMISGISVRCGMLWIICSVVLVSVLDRCEMLLVMLSVKLMLLLMIRLVSVWVVDMFRCVNSLFEVVSCSVVVKMVDGCGMIVLVISFVVLVIFYRIRMVVGMV